MANPAKSLSARVHWLFVFRAILESEPLSTILPATIECPLCGCDRLDVCEDAVLGGEWFHCRGCKFAGDIIELVAKHAAIEILEALARLQACRLLDRSLTPDCFAAYERDHVDYRARLNAFWKVASGNLLNHYSRAARNLMHQLGVARATDSIYTIEHVQRFLGVASHQQVEDVFYPDSYAVRHRNNRNGKTSPRRGSGPGARRMFELGGWDDVLVMPFSDLPGRISGFLIVGREGNEMNGDWIFKRANFGGTRQKAAHEAGWGMLSGNEEARSPWGELENDLFVMCDARVAICLQGIWAIDHATPLPILLAADEPGVISRRLPPELQRRNVIFWTHDGRPMPQAIESNAQISRYPISEKEISRRLGHHGPLDWLRLIRRNCRPWRADLRELIRGRSWCETEVLLRGLSLKHWELRAFIEGSELAIREKLERCNPTRIGRNLIPVCGKRVLETDDGWEIDKSNERICNLPLRVKEVVYCENRSAYYRGYAMRGPNQLQFTVDCHDVDRRGLFPCVAEFLLHNYRVWLTYSPTWAKRSFQLALAFHSPEVTTGSDRVGWHSQTKSFLFPKFQIHMGGRVDSDNNLVGVTSATPAANLEPPHVREFRSVPPELRGTTPETSVVWSLVACIVHNLFAAAQSRDPLGIVLDGGETIPTARTAALGLGCVEQSLRSSARLEQLQVASSRHDWPVLVHFPNCRKRLVTAEWVDSRATKNAILPLDRHAALVLASYPGFARIRAAGPLRPLGHLGQAAPVVLKALVPAFLEHACRNRLDQDLWNDGHPLYAWLRHLAAWVAEQDLDNRGVLAARRFIFVDSLAPWRTLVELAQHMCYRDDLRNSDSTMPSEIPAIVYHHGTETNLDSVQIPIRDINGRLAADGLPVLDLEAIKRALVREGAWRTFDDAGQHSDWLLDRKWWDGWSFVSSRSASAKTPPMQSDSRIQIFWP
jgi:hypothetical protein